MGRSGIYTITNIVNNKIYVGYSNDLDGRGDQHFRELLNRTHGNVHLQAAYNEYGKENLRFEILEECDIRFLATQEHYWCIMLQTHNKMFGYNIRPTNPYNRPSHNIEARQKISKAFNKPVIRLSLKGEFIDRYDSTRCLCKELSLQEYLVSAVLTKKKRQYKNFVFVFEKDYDINKDYSFKKIRITTKPIEMYNKEGILINTFNNLSEAAEFMNVCHTSIRKAIIKSKKHECKNYIWKFKN